MSFDEIHRFFTNYEYTPINNQRSNIRRREYVNFINETINPVIIVDVIPTQLNFGTRLDNNTNRLQNTIPSSFPDIINSLISTDNN